jgi:ABC-type spermidine/putrescine transport system permease subunit II
MIFLRLLVAAAVLVFYLPVISGVPLAIADAAGWPGWSPGGLTGWWKTIGNMAAEGAGLSEANKENMFVIWGFAALLAVIGHTLMSIGRAWARR